MALCILAAESGFNQYVVNPDSGTVGPWQFRPSAQQARWEALGYTYDDMFDWAKATAVAWDLYVDRQGWSAWDGSPQCWA